MNILVNLSGYANSKLNTESIINKQNGLSNKSSIPSISHTNSVRNPIRTHLLSQTLAYDLQNDATKRLINTFSQVKEIADYFDDNQGASKLFDNSNDDKNDLLKSIQSKLNESVNGYWKSDPLTVTKTLPSEDDKKSFDRLNSDGQLILGSTLKTTYFTYTDDEKKQYLSDHKDEIIGTLLDTCMQFVERATNDYPQQTNYGYAQPTNEFDKYCEKTSLDGLGFININSISDMREKALQASGQLNKILTEDEGKRRILLDEAKKYGDITFTYA